MSQPVGQHVGAAGRGRPAGRGQHGRAGIRMSIGRGLLAGVTAGAAGTTALNAVTYLDMAIRGRPSSSTPEDTVQKLVDLIGATIPGDKETRANRLAGLGPLTGLTAGIGAGALLGVIRWAGWRSGLAASTLIAGLAAMAAGDGPMTALGVTDPRTWAPVDWVSDAIPHLAYGAVTAWALQLMND
jgi:hypothetical protein